MRISRERLEAEAETTGFHAEILEKVFQLLNLLERVQEHPFLKGRVALKGGTALNLFLLKLPRLSVDIDMNYIGAIERDAMLGERPQFETALEAVCGREGMTVLRQPSGHAGGKWQLQYTSSITGSANLEVDLNYMYRVPLWPTTTSDSQPLGSFRARGIPILDIHEIAAGKLAALLSRRAVRDLFDTHQLLASTDLDPQKLRLAFVLYGAMNRKDWRTVTADDVTTTHREMESQLLPLLRGGLKPDRRTLSEWTDDLVARCHRALGQVLPLTANEMEFLDRLLDCGQIVPSLLTNDQHMAQRINRHPLLRWKALNVRRYRKGDHNGGRHDA